MERFIYLGFDSRSTQVFELNFVNQKNVIFYLDYESLKQVLRSKSYTISYDFSFITDVDQNICNTLTLNKIPS